jgi:hypothetical protein
MILYTSKIHLCYLLTYPPVLTTITLPGIIFALLAPLILGEFKMLKKMIVATAAFIALPALAGTQTWNLNDGSFNYSGNGNTMTINGANSNNLGITGWSDTGGTNDDKIENGKLTYGSSYGLMLQNRDESNTTPSHSIDNFDNDFDMVLLSFDKAIDLEGFNIGWARETDTSGNNYGYADVTVAAYTGAGNFAFNAADTWSSIAGTNWSTIGHYGNVSDYSYQSVTTDVKSKYWLIGAYNPTFTGAGETTNGPGTGWRDGFKLASVTGQTYTPPSTNVPEPGTMAILASGLLGLFATRRRKQAGL